jgi:hypothetical protein
MCFYVFNNDSAFLPNDLKRSLVALHYFVYPTESLRSRDTLVVILNDKSKQVAGNLTYLSLECYNFRLEILQDFRC